MSVTLRIILLAASVLTFIWALKKIRNAQVALQDAVFWLLSALLLVIMGAFPDLVIGAANLVGVASPVNFVFLCIIFVLLVKVFLMSIKLSQLEYKLQRLVQHDAIAEKKLEDKERYGTKH